MKSGLLLLLLTPTFLSAFSQESSVAYSVTGKGNGNFDWSNIREINMNSGNTTATIFENGKTKFSFINPETGMSVYQFTYSGSPVSLNQSGPFVNTSTNQITTIDPSPTGLMSAAIAYDKKHERLFFATMKTGQLIWLDLRSASGTAAFFTTGKLLVSNVNYNDEAFNITRMTIGADGYGYAMTNDANHLIKFTTGNKIVATDLGSLIDAENNNGVSVHNKCTSWGGDLVADAFGKLYLFGAGRSVFVIDPQTLIATYKGSITNLSGTFSVNGAAAIDDENVILSSANTFEGFYKVNINSLAATKINSDGAVYNASDLASSNLLHESEKLSSVGTPALRNIDASGNNLITIYPNPVSDNQVKITFDGNIAGKYMLQLTDLQGRVLESSVVYIKGPGQVANFEFQRKPAGGLYMIKITDNTRKIIYSDKVVVE